MGKNKDSKFANDYQIPVEVLRDGLPLLLRDAQDDEVRGGNLVRVATADGLALTLSQQAPGSDPLQVYLVHYIAPKEAQRIESMVEDMKKEPQAEAGGAAAAGAPFVIVNELVLQAKALALMAMGGEITDINTTMEEVRAKEQAPYYIAKTSLVDHGLQAGDHLKRLKKAYFASRALAGMEEKEHLMELAAEYQQQCPQHKFLALAEIVQQLLGLLAFLDFQDKKRLLTPEDLAGVSNDRSRILKMLKRQRLKFRKLIDKQSLIGAEFVDFPRL